ncbi:hypothetical protein [Thermodesulforhabdus norvegica]|uniref:Uncharacterized protein n=1 Tax=Thermodesulforhabdus norvegica TaxID=39841 RepID=A0A1I4UVK2_9BACT|nr:hypothetical protein [Thermodesulforhabdus norvegica]SFM92938.1 hypothetical protein SAMN05660836_01988 [Thermodesulforhabdus norvegica]
MVRKKKLEITPGEELMEDDEIIELEEVVEEPEELPLGEDLDDMLFAEDADISIDEADIKDLDLDLGIDEAEMEDTRTVEQIPEPEPLKGEETVKEKTAQDFVDSLFQEALLEKEEEKVHEGGEVSALTPQEVLPAQAPDLDEIIDRLEERLVSKFEEIVEARLPELVLKTVKQELEALKKELEE